MAAPVLASTIVASRLSTRLTKNSISPVGCRNMQKVTAFGSRARVCSLTACNETISRHRHLIGRCVRNISQRALSGYVPCVGIP